MKSIWRVAIGGAAFACASVMVSPAFAQSQLDQAVDQAETTTSAAAASQERIDSIDEQKGDLFREYRAVLQRIDSQTLFVEQQRIFLTSQENELADLERQIEDVDTVLQELAPMQSEMIAQIDNFVRLDIPFLRQERIDRIDALRELMTQPPTNVPPAEKYRKILEAYEIELDYGRFLRTWEEQLWSDPEAGPDPDAPTVDFLLIGRVAFIYMTKDESELGIWDAAANQWTRLDGGFKPQVRQAIRMAKEVTTPNVFFPPVPGAAAQ